MSIIKFKAGELLRHSGKTYRFKEALGISEILAEDAESGATAVLPIPELEAISTHGTVSNEDLSRVDEETMERELKKFKAIEPLIKKPKDGSKQYLEIAKKLGRSVSTVYRWRKTFIGTGSVASLRNKKPGVKKGSRRLVKAVDEILDELLANDYLTEQKLSPTDIHERLTVALARKGIDARPAHINTIRNRIALLNQKDVTGGRHGAAAAEQKHTENVARLIADHPLAIIQVDHTKLDIIIVTDDEYRLPIGRAWITVVFDVYSRVVLGFYISLDSPSAQSVGLAVARAILPKEKWLAALDLKEFQWPCWGRPTVIHADNGPDFKSDTVKKACHEHHIDMHWRPVRRPNWGGHIEAMMKELARLLKELPGATFSNPRERGNYDSEANAAMTMNEIERYIMLRIIGVYHHELHTGIGMSPLKKWDAGLWKTDEGGPGIGLPERIVGAAEKKLRLDFMPYQERTIGPYGALINGVHYFSDELRPFINQRVPGKPRLARKFIFRIDYRCIKFVHFWDENARLYREIATRDLSFPEVTYWSLRRARAKVKADGKDPNDERVIVKALVAGREMVEKSIKDTKAARRAAEQAKRNKTAYDTAKPSAPHPRKVPTPIASGEDEIPDIKPFTNVKAW